MRIHPLPYLHNSQQIWSLKLDLLCTSTVYNLCTPVPDTKWTLTGNISETPCITYLAGSLFVGVRHQGFLPDTSLGTPTVSNPSSPRPGVEVIWI